MYIIKCVLCISMQFLIEELNENINVSGEIIKLTIKVINCGPVPISKLSIVSTLRLCNSNCDSKVRVLPNLIILFKNYTFVRFNHPVILTLILINTGNLLYVTLERLPFICRMNALIYQYHLVNFFQEMFKSIVFFYTCQSHPIELGALLHTAKLFLLKTVF